LQKKIDWIQGNPALLRSYLRYEKAASDKITRIHGAKQKGRREEKIEVAQNLKALEDSSEKIAKVTGLSVDEIALRTRTEIT
jgi:predicted transposase/invertase (TIGR01784 family)